MSKLKQIQEWMVSVISHPNGAIKGAEETTIDDQHWSIPSVISPSKTLTGK